MNIIIFTGLPASGKTSISKHISNILGIKCISKDDLKVELYEKYGFTSNDEKKYLSTIADKRMYKKIIKYIFKNVDLIIDNYFKNFYIMKDILKNISYNKITIICIFCYADYTILANRYNDRIFNKKRHISLSINNQYPIINNITKFHEKININNVMQSYNQIEEEVFGNHTLKINTNNIDKDFNIICNNIIEFIKNIKQS